MSPNGTLSGIIAVFTAWLLSPFDNLFVIGTHASRLSGPLPTDTSIIFVANDTIKSCYRNPVLLQTPNNSLLCFIEERYRGEHWKPSNISGDHSCSDNYGFGPSEQGGHNLGFSRSDDGGVTWSPITRLAGNLSNLAAHGAVDFTNNAAMVVELPSKRKRILWQYGELPRSFL